MKFHLLENYLNTLFGSKIKVDFVFKLIYARNFNLQRIFDTDVFKIIWLYTEDVMVWLVCMWCKCNRPLNIKGKLPEFCIFIHI
jgi:hypothetical protein